MGRELSKFVEVLAERKIWRFSAVYIVVGFSLVEASDIILPRLQFPSSSGNFVLAGLFFCFPIALSAVWMFRGAKRQKTVNAVIPLTAIVIVAAPLWALAYRAMITDSTDSASPDLPLVVMMDSHHPSRVYDEETLTAHGTNADVLSDILLDLPIRRQRESIGPAWRRDEEILRFNPDLILIHYSGFRQDHLPVPRERLKLFMKYFLDSETQFLIYSRATGVELETVIKELFADISELHPSFLDRIHVFGLDDYGPRKWRSPSTANPLKLQVKNILNLN